MQRLQAAAVSGMLLLRRFRPAHAMFIWRTLVLLAIAIIARETIIANRQYREVRRTLSAIESDLDQASEDIQDIRTEIDFR